MHFHPEDVRKVASAILSIKPELYECRSDFRMCMFCGERKRVYYENGSEVDSGKFPHATDCVTLIAQDLLTQH